MDTCELKNIPMPPTANRLYRNPSERERAIFLSKGMSPPGRFKSKNYDVFYSEMKAWCLQNMVKLNLARAMTLRLGPGVFLRCDVTFVFDERTILTKKMTPKRNDTFNRVKALHDVLAEALGVDDCWIWSGSIDKTWRDHPAFPECANVTLSLMEIKR